MTQLVQAWASQLGSALYPECVDSGRGGGSGGRGRDGADRVEGQGWCSRIFVDILAQEPPALVSYCCVTNFCQIYLILTPKQVF